jgi:hypothetical protein
MTGKAYYLTTLGAWRRHAGRLTNSHWVALCHTSSAETEGAEDTACRATTEDESCGLLEMTQILALIEADEGGHLTLQDDPEFEQLPHPLAQRPISKAAQDALAVHGVATGATTFDAAEAIAKVHPLLRHRVF